MVDFVLRRRGLLGHFSFLNRPKWEIRCASFFPRLETRAGHLEVTVKLETDFFIMASCVLEVKRILYNGPLIPVSYDVKDQTSLTFNSLLLLRDSKGLPGT